MKHPGIRSVTLNIADAVDPIHTQLKAAGIDTTAQAQINLPPRIRTSALYAVSQSMNGRIINTCNLSEDRTVYSTRYGDCAGDVSLPGKLTVQEVKAIGQELGLPENLIRIAPSDGLCGTTDEQIIQYVQNGSGSVDSEPLFVKKANAENQRKIWQKSKKML